MHKKDLYEKDIVEEKKLPSSDEHLLIGAIAGVLAYTGYRLHRRKEIKIEGVIKSAIVGGIFSLAPDILEPATNPNHRALFHSITTLTSGSYGSYKGLKNDKINESIKELLVPALAGYSSHLLADGTTPKGLPILGLV